MKEEDVHENIPALEGSNDCPAGATKSTPIDCMRMPQVYGGTASNPFQIRSTADPGGCFTLNHKFWYFNNAPGHGRVARTVYCSCGEASTFQAALDGDNQCPHGTDSLTPEACRLAAVNLGGKVHPGLKIKAAGDPKGCFRFGKTFYFNTHSEGAARFKRQPICKRGAAVSLSV